MPQGIRLETWGPYALFSRPETKVERVSYDVMTPSAARGLLEAILWHPGMRWHVDSIRVLNPIRFTGVRRNEVKSKANGNALRAMMNGGAQAGINCRREIMQRASMVLRDVHYVIEAYFELTDKAAESDNQGKFCDIMRRRLEKGQCYHQPCFGCREFPAAFECLDGDAPQTGLPPADRDKDLGLMLHDIDFARDMTPRFFRARLQNGILTVPPFAEATA